jgi:PmbA protein
MGLTGESSVVRNWKEIDFQNLFSSASDSALKIMDAKSIASEKMPIVFKNKIFARILSIMFSGTLCADAIQNKRSPWIGRLGEQIASDKINLTDDGLLEAGVGTSEFDDEGTPQQVTPLISKGILKNYLYDSYTANKDKTSSTGNASRGYTGPPMPRPNNLTLKQTNIKQEELIKDTKRGLYVAEVIGDWLSNPINGNLSVTVVNGFLIERGELTQPVKDVIISGNFFNIVKDGIDLIASDLINSGSAYAPSVRINTMTVTENR